MQISGTSLDVMLLFSSHRLMAMCLRIKRNPSTWRAWPEHLLRMRPRWGLCSGLCLHLCSFTGVLRNLFGWRENKCVMIVLPKLYFWDRVQCQCSRLTCEAVSVFIRSCEVIVETEKPHGPLYFQSLDFPRAARGQACAAAVKILFFSPASSTLQPLSREGGQTINQAGPVQSTDQGAVAKIVYRGVLAREMCLLWASRSLQGRRASTMLGFMCSHI